MAIQRVTISVSNILQGGQTCTNPTIEAHLVNGLTMPCPISNGTIELQLDGLEAGYCFDLVIDCEDCNACPPQVKRICLCDTNDDCAACETCTNGICVSNCETDEFCDNGSCKECLVDANCPCNQECINGSCDCPPDLPIEVNGCCYECVEGTTNESCQVCVGGRWAAKDCGENWLLDPEDCECKQCLDSGDCVAPNTCCVNGSCQCCPGYYFDPASGGCIVIPDCSDAVDCPDCFDCVNGVCVEITCPAGYVRTAIAGSCCVKECDCDNPSCVDGSTCVPYDENTCYCKPCSGECVDNTDCSDGCGCYNGNCEPSPRECTGPCYTGADCGVGCGCLDGECVDCKTLGCNNNDDCLIASGCTCINNNCVGSPCDNPCTNAEDCENGCGCDNGQCKKCDDVPCVTTDDCPDGCLCNDGICGSNPCDTVYCTKPEDCGEGCGCKEGMCVPCESLDCVSSDCNDVPGCNCVDSNCQSVRNPCADNLTVDKIDENCQLKANLDTTNCCACPDILLAVTAAFVTTSLTVTGRLRKGTAVSDPLLSATGVDNELPLSGTVKFIVRQDEIEVDGSGAPTGNTRSTTQSINKDFSGSDTQSNVFTITEIGDTYIDGGSNWKVIHICVSVEHISTFVFPNECQYKAFDKELVCDANGTGLLQLTKLTMCKTPLFTWYDSINGTSWSEIKKEYGSRVDSDSYEDYLNTEDVAACEYYKVTVDCGCDPDEYYSCYGDEQPATKLVFCQPSDLTITPANDCNSEIDIDQVLVCDAMCSASYSLYINGVLEGTYSPDENCYLFSTGLNIVKTFAITEVKLVFNCDTCDECTIVKTLSITGDPCDCAADVMTLAVDTTNACTSGIDYTITNGSPDYAVTIKRGATTIYSTTKSADGTYTYNNILPNGTYVLIVTDGYGCTKTKGFIINACCQISVSSLAYDCNTQTISGIIADSNASGSFLLEIGSPAMYTYGEASGAFAEVQDLMDGEYYVKVTDSINGDCFWEGTLFVSCEGLSMDIAAICDTADTNWAGVSVSNLTGGTGPYSIKVYAGSPVTTTNGCPNDESQFVGFIPSVPYDLYSGDWDETTEVLIKVTDSIGRVKCFHPLYMLNCAENVFSFSTRASCDGSQKRVCVIADVTGTYTITLGTDTPFSDTLVAGVEKCYNTSMANGTYNVTLENNAGVSITHSVVITTCSNYTASYDCNTGLSLFQDGSAWTGKIKVDGSPVSYWNYTGPNTVYLADTTPNHTITLYSASLVLLGTITVSSIDCCRVTLSNVTGSCDPITSDGVIEFTINDLIHPAGTHSVTIKDSSNAVVESNPNWTGTNYVSADLPNDTYTIFVTDDSYNIPNVGIGSGYECTASAVVGLNCNMCTIENGLNASLITTPSNLKLTIYNSNGYAVNYEVWRNDVNSSGDCLPVSDPPPGLQIGSNSLNAGGAVTLNYSLNAPGTDPCFYVKFVKQGDATCKAVKLASTAN